MSDEPNPAEPTAPAAPEAKGFVPKAFEGVVTPSEPAAPVKAPAVRNDDEFNFPRGIPLADMTAEQESEYWREKAQKHEQRSKKNFDELEKLRTAGLSEQEKAVKTARDEGRAEARKDSALEIAAAKLEAAGVPAEDIADLDLSKFLNEDTTVDAAKVTATGARFNKRVATPPPGSADAGPQGDTPATPSIDEQIAKATQDGDLTTVMALNNKKLAMSAGIS